MAMDAEQFEELLVSLEVETDRLLDVASGLEAKEWYLRTPARGWNIHAQMVHLAYFDEIARLGFIDPGAFEETKGALLATGDNWVDTICFQRADMEPQLVSNWLMNSRHRLVELYRRLGPGARTDWFGPSMSAASSATARYMETWAHGQDIYDTLGRAHVVDDGVGAICHLGAITRGFSYALRGRKMPAEDIGLELVLPSGALWTHGDPSTSHRVRGDAVDFALVVTQRRHVADTELLSTPGPAAEWLTLAQAFAGAPGTGRSAGSFPSRGGSAAVVRTVRGRTS